MEGESHESSLRELRRFRGRIVLAEPDGTLHLGRTYEVLRSADDGATWTSVGRLPCPGWRRAAEGSRLASRLIRQEVRALARLSDGTLVAASRTGVFRCAPGERRFSPARLESGPLAAMPPMRIGVGPDDVVIWGEYGSPRQPRPVRLFASRDGGRSHQVVQTLEAGSVMHVHNVFLDARGDHYWVLAGDHEREPGIGRLSRDLGRFEWLVKGEQRYRAVAAFDLGDRLVYATDTEMEPNGLMVLEKASGRVERLRGFAGSCIYGCRFGGLFALTTTVEPSPVNRSPFAELWISRDALDWRCVFRARKDRWSADWLQFGSIVLPSGSSEREILVFSGQAVSGIDGHTVVARVGPAPADAQEPGRSSA